MPAAPTSPVGSCWHFFPTGCPCTEGSGCATNGGSASGPSTAWVEDTWGPANGQGGKDGCEARANGQNGWCGVSDVLYHFVEAAVRVDVGPVRANLRE